MPVTGRGDSTAEGLWDAVDVARYLKVSRSWVYQHAEDGTLPYLKIGFLLRFQPEQIRAYAKGEAIPEGSVVPIAARKR